MYVHVRDVESGKCQSIFPNVKSATMSTKTQRTRIAPITKLLLALCVAVLRVELIFTSSIALSYDEEKNQKVGVGHSSSTIDQLVDLTVDTADTVVSPEMISTTTDIGEGGMIGDKATKEQDSGMNIAHDNVSTVSTAATGNTNTSSEKQQQRCWGVNSCTTSTSTYTVEDARTTTSESLTSNSNNNNHHNTSEPTTTTTTSTQNIKKKTPFNSTPFVHVDVSLNPKTKMLPPEGYRVTAVVYAKDDGLSYFWKGDQSQQHQDQLPYIPFLECNAVGSTTAQLPFQYGTFRNFPCGAQPAFFLPATYPGQLLICLSAVQLTVSGNQEETRTFRAGDVILLEDTTGKGHKVRACCSTDCTDSASSSDLASHVHDDMNVMLLTLPHPSGWQHKGSSSNFNNQRRIPTSKVGSAWHLFQRYHAGQDGIPLPCKEELDPSYSAHGSTTKTESPEMKSSMALDFDASKSTVLNFLWTWRLLIVEALILPLKPSLRLCDIIIALNKRWKSDRILDPNIIFSSCYWFTRGISWALLAIGEEYINWIQRRKTEEASTAIEDDEEENELIIKQSQYKIRQTSTTTTDSLAEGNKEK